MTTSYQPPAERQLSLFDEQESLGVNLPEAIPHSSDQPVSEPDFYAGVKTHGNGELVRRDGSWWIVGLRHVEDCGPYATRAEAESDLRGMRRTLQEMEGRS